MPHIEKRGMPGRAVDKLLAASPVGIKGDIESQARRRDTSLISGAIRWLLPPQKFNANEKQCRGGMMDYEKDPARLLSTTIDVMSPYNTHMSQWLPVVWQIESHHEGHGYGEKNGTHIDPDSNLAKGDKISSKATIAVQDFR